MTYKENAATLTEIVIYTDPLCCWSAALQNHLDRLKPEVPETVVFRYCMAGMIPTWKSFEDPVNSINRPVQMGPMWMEAKHLTGAKIDESIWVTDPPSSSLPACIAVKTAELQSAEAGTLMLFALRKAVMQDRKNIAKDSVLSEIATTLSNEYPDVFNALRFKKEYNQPASRNALRKDMEETKLHRIERFPTVKIKSNVSKSIVITGYKPYEVYSEALSSFAENPIV